MKRRSQPSPKAAYAAVFSQWREIQFSEWKKMESQAAILLPSSGAFYSVEARDAEGRLIAFSYRSDRHGTCCYAVVDVAAHHAAEAALPAALAAAHRQACAVGAYRLRGDAAIIHRERSIGGQGRPAGMPRGEWYARQRNL